MTLTITCSLMTGHLFDAIIVALTDIELKYLCWELMRTTLKLIEKLSLQ